MTETESAAVTIADVSLGGLVERGAQSRPPGAESVVFDVTGRRSAHAHVADCDRCRSGLGHGAHHFLW